jgi:hypothetical protein
VRKVRVPAESLAANAFAVTSYGDAFALDLPEGVTRDVDELTLLIATASPWWVDGLMRLRDRIVSVVGLRAAGRRDPGAPRTGALRVGDKAGIFTVVARSADEVMLGGDDRHLDFRASVLVRRRAKGDSVVLATVVHYNNWQGRAYFLVVRPFHKVIVKSILRDAAKRLAAGATG